MLTPLHLGGSTDPEKQFCYHQSRMRVKVECAFGRMVARWGILWRPLRVSIDLAPRVLEACAQLHNWCSKTQPP
jgi:hypothetical protein